MAEASSSRLPLTSTMPPSDTTTTEIVDHVMADVAAEAATLKAAALVPRKYQEEIFSRAQKGNIIAALDTGSGKTFISVLLMRWMSTLQFKERKCIIFLVPKVPLVEQQMRFIEAQTPLTVRGFCGATSTDLWDRHKWNTWFTTSDVLVMTPAVFENALAHSHWSMSRVSLLIFDECHHAQKNHPYNTIMQNYFEPCPFAERPKIFGMTASPIWNLGKALNSLRLLEFNLHSSVLAVRDHAKELAQSSPRPQELIEQYSPSPACYPAYPSPTLWEKLDASGNLTIIGIREDTLRMRHSVTLASLGPYGADSAIYAFYTRRVEDMLALVNKGVVVPMEHALIGTGIDVRALLRDPAAFVRRSGEAGDEGEGEEDMDISDDEGEEGEYRSPSMSFLPTPYSGRGYGYGEADDVAIPGLPADFRAPVDSFKSFKTKIAGMEPQERAKLKADLETVKNILDEYEPLFYEEIPPTPSEEAEAEAAITIATTTDVAMAGIDEEDHKVSDISDCVSVVSEARSTHTTITQLPTPSPSPVPALPLPPREVDLEWTSPKVQKLVSILRSCESTAFQGIVFVDQRQVAGSLSKILSRIPELHGWLRCKELTGHGNSAGKGGGAGSLKVMGISAQKEVVRQFREGEINLLIATSVAEEGLDFPACDLVVRFDPMQHIVGYVQSRGRARHHTSRFIVMLERGSALDLARYRAFAQTEPELRKIYQRDRTYVDFTVEDIEMGVEPEEAASSDVAARERYTVEATGATLTYHSAMGLLNHLCALIPRDKFTPPHRPLYLGDMKVTLELPTALPLPVDDLTYHGPERTTKKEARRAVAFQAVKALHARGVFDDYLLPVEVAPKLHKTDKGTMVELYEDADGRPVPDVSDIPETMDVLVADPWIAVAVPKLYVHTLLVDGQPTAGIVTGTKLPPVELVGVGSVRLATSEGREIRFDAKEEMARREMMQQFTKTGLWWCVTGRPIDTNLTAFLVPLTLDGQPDFLVMEYTMVHSIGSYDWSGITEAHYDHLIVMNNKEHGRPLLLKNIRHDLTPRSLRQADLDKGVERTYAEYFLEKWTRQDVVPEIPMDDPLVECQVVRRYSSAAYAFKPEDEVVPTPRAPLIVYAPLSFCRWLDIPEDILPAFRYLPSVLRRVTDLYRINCARVQLSLPTVPDDLLVEAYTLPSANAGFNNQRFETLGDSVLKLSVVVYLYNKFPHRHEGQLDSLRKNCVSNNILLGRAKEIGLERFLSCETQSARVWRYVHQDDDGIPCPDRYARRQYPRRSLQDCIEATLGASFVHGGIPSALQAGTALGLCFGGPTVWSERYGRPDEIPPARLFRDLQETLGYQFRSGKLLLEAITHPSFQSPGASYQRLEFLGDALIDLVVTRYLFKKFPDATSGQMSLARSKAVCAPAFASIAVRKLSLHKYLLANNVELSIAMMKHISILENTSAADIVKEGWAQDPPKAVSDVLESIMGAMFVDSGYDFEMASGIIERCLEDILEVLTPHMQRDPVSELMIWTAKAGCRKVRYRRTQLKNANGTFDTVVILVHDVVVVEPLEAENLNLAKGLASQRARTVLIDPLSDKCLSRLCDCLTRDEEDDEADADQDDETERGFAKAAKGHLREVAATATSHRRPLLQDEGDDMELEDAHERMAVDQMLDLVESS